MFTGENLRLLRLIKGVAQKTIAKNLGTTQQAVSKKERSKNVSEVMLDAYLKAANISKEEFEKLKKFLPPPKINRITF